MTKLTKKYGKHLSILVIAALMLSILVFTANGFNMGSVKAVGNNEESRIASEISNMTGANIEEILKFKRSGKSWNEILDILKKRNNGDNQDNRNIRNDVLTQEGIGEDFLDKLKQEGFNEDEIMDAKLITERVVFQIQQICSTEGNAAEVPKVDANLNNNENDTTTYIELKEKIDVKTAIYLILKLRKDFGSYEKVLDEYLYSLQIDLSLEEYLIDKASYQKLKEEKSIGINLQKIITLEKIEEKMLEEIQSEIVKNDSDSLPEPKAVSAEGTVKTEVEIPLPEMPKSGISEVKPKNPADEIMNEIKAIDPVSNR